MTAENRIALLEAQLETVALERDQARELLREMATENARLRAHDAAYRERQRRARAATGLAPGMEGM